MWFSWNMPMSPWTAKWRGLSLLHLQELNMTLVGQFTSCYLLKKLIASTNFVCVQVNGHNLKDANSHQTFNGWCQQYLIQNMYVCQRSTRLPAYLMPWWNSTLVNTIKITSWRKLSHGCCVIISNSTKVYFLEGYQTCITIQGQSDHIHTLSDTVTLPQHFASPLCCNYKYRVLGDLQWHVADTKFCQNSFTSSKLVSHTQCYIYRWLLPWNPCNSASKRSVQVSPTAHTSTIYTPQNQQPVFSV